MKSLAVLVLFFAIPLESWAVSMTQCSDGVHYYVTADGASTCPPTITFLSASPGDTSVVVSGTTNVANGTVYVSIRSSCTRAKWRDVHDSIGDVNGGTDATVTDGTFSVSITGLSESTGYCAHVGQLTTAYRISRPRVTEFTTLPSSTTSGDAITGGDDRFYCPASGDWPGNDSNPGTSGSAPKATIPAKDSGFNPGDDMWLCRGGIWTNIRHEMSRAGSESNRNEVGCYYMDGVTPRKCVDGTQGMASEHKKPVIRGALNSGCIADRTCTYPVGGDAVVPSIYKGQFDVLYTADHTTISNIAFEYTRYYTLMLIGSGVGGSLTDVIVDGVDGRYIGHGALIEGVNGVQDVVIRNSSLYYGSTCEMTDRSPRVSTDTGACRPGGSPAWPAAFISITRSPNARSLLEYNDGARMFGEGISHYNSKGPGYAIWRNNRVMNTWSDAYYIDGVTDVVVENNIAVAGSGQMDSVISGKMFACYHVGDEQPNFPSPLRNLIRNNLCVGAANSINTDIQADAAVLVNGAYRKVGAKFYGNTSIAAVKRDVFHLVPTNNLEELDYKNNVHWTNGISTADACGNSYSNGTFVDNHWSANPSNSTCDHAGDTNGDPGLTVSNYATWTGYASQTGSSPISWPTFANIDPAGGGAIINAGTALTSPILDVSNFGSAWTSMTNRPSEANWECAWCLDATGAVRDGTPSKGAVE